MRAKRKGIETYGGRKIEKRPEYRIRELDWGHVETSESKENKNRDKTASESNHRRTEIDGGRKREEIKIRRRDWGHVQKRVRKTKAGVKWQVRRN